METLLRKLTINLRLWLILALALCSLALVSFLAMKQEQAALMYQKNLQLSQLLEMTDTTLNHFYQRAAKGEITHEDAKQRAFNVIRESTFTTQQDKDYFFLIDQQGVNLMHARNPALENTNIRDLRDLNGFAYIQDILNKSNQANTGNTHYDSTRPGSNDQVTKLAVFQNFKPWKIVVVTSIYLDNVQAHIWDHAIKLFLSFLFAAAIMTSLVLIIINSIKKPLTTMLARMLDVANGEGDLTRRLPLEGQDELTNINKAFNQFIEKIQDLVKQANQSSLAVSAAAEELSAVTQQSSLTIQQQGQETDQVATAMNEMTATVQEVATNASNAADAARQAIERKNESNSQLNAMLKTITELETSIEDTATTLEHLKEGTANINVIMEVISSVAEQTNLLALNAAIEAARAGEHGRGFAVVADEVRGLAARTQESTSEIKTTIEALVTEADLSHKSMAISRKKVLETIENAKKTTDALEEVAAAIELIADMNHQIASAAEEQAAVADEINRNIVNINELSSQTQDGSQQTNQASHELAGLAETLNQQVSQFKT